MVIHNTLIGSELHFPLGHATAGLLSLTDNLADAYLIENGTGGRDLFGIDTTTGADLIKTGVATFRWGNHAAASSTVSPLLQIRTSAGASREQHDWAYSVAGGIIYTLTNNVTSANMSPFVQLGHSTSVTATTSTIRFRSGTGVANASCDVIWSATNNFLDINRAVRIADDIHMSSLSSFRIGGNWAVSPGASSIWLGAQTGGVGGIPEQILIGVNCKGHSLSNIAVFGGSGVEVSNFFIGQNSTLQATDTPLGAASYTTTWARTQNGVTHNAPTTLRIDGGRGWRNGTGGHVIIGTVPSASAVGDAHGTPVDLMEFEDTGKITIRGNASFNTLDHQLTIHRPSGDANGQTFSALRVDMDGSTSDGVISWEVDSSTAAIGVDNSDSDAWKVSYGAETLGGNTTDKVRLTATTLKLDPSTDNTTQTGHYIETKFVQTTDNTTTNIWNKTLNTGEQIFIRAMVSGRGIATDQRTANMISGLFYRENAGALQEGATATLVDIDSSLMMLEYSVVFNTSSNDVQIVVDGAAGQTIDWVASVEYQIMTGGFVV